MFEEFKNINNKKFMNKSELIEKMGAQLGITSGESERYLNNFIALIYSELSEGNKVNISGFGCFSVSHRASRIGVNPRQPSVKITIPELNTPKFKAGEAFKEAIKFKGPQAA